MEKKRVEESRTEQVYVLRYKDINGHGRLFGGMLLQWIDELAGIVSRRHCQREVTTAAIDNLSFKSGAHLNDMIVLSGKLTYVGNSSMEVRVDTYIEDQYGMRRSINRAYMVMVAIDEEGKAVKVPGLELQTETEREEWNGGEKRYLLRKRRRIEGF
ncbi:acyl-CoA thioesterase [Clostridium sp. AM58-1XD]|uniref:acyl-CoA thioesterase n=1 Tax=Clostridium sp. AM58-1XD TaxID=2292307 RepID=UPI000E470F25|nr:acyl-CoA thioesterase [Clostridium sp. AM58-1XD]RGZ01629.1 acyl-CoA thioesterase [Clostridium sp. AM58-1XD]